jgi:serine/threonine protein kinase
MLVASMHARLVVHLDIKADNVLIRPLSTADNSSVSLLLADFGEAMVLGQGSAAAMKQSRGTECIQAPEMLMAGKIKGRFIHSFCYRFAYSIEFGDHIFQVPSML